MQSAQVYPACAGIDLFRLPVFLRSPGLPRMRGDRPRQPSPGGPGARFTPHARGSTFRLISLSPFGEVYPACAGIDPIPQKGRIPLTCLPRMRGDRPPPYSFFAGL